MTCIRNYEYSLLHKSEDMKEKNDEDLDVNQPSLGPHIAIQKSGVPEIACILHSYWQKTSDSTRPGRGSHYGPFAREVPLATQCRGVLLQI